MFAFIIFNSSTSSRSDSRSLAVPLCVLYPVGTQNYSGLSVFSAVPIDGSIAPGQSRDITVTFQPDHPSVNYSDRLTIELMNKVRRDSHLENRTLNFTLITGLKVSHDAALQMYLLHPVCLLFTLLFMI